MYVHDGEGLSQWQRARGAPQWPTVCCARSTTCTKLHKRPDVRRRPGPVLHRTQTPPDPTYTNQYSHQSTMLAMEDSSHQSSAHRRAIVSKIHNIRKLYQYYVNIISILYQYYINIISILYQYFSNGNSILNQKKKLDKF